MGEIFGHRRLRDIPMDRVSVSDKERDSFLLRSGDLLFARQSLVLSGAGKCSLFLADTEPVTFESHLIRARLNHDVADPAFYFYFFNSPQGRGIIESIVEQVAAAGIRGSDLARLEVPYLPLTEQRRIAQILGALDDKIDLNRDVNETLELIVQTIFKSWFVDAAQMSLPQGWRESTIGEEVVVLGGSTPSTKRPEFWENGVIHFATPKDLANLMSPILLDTERKITEAGLAQISSRLLPVGAVLLSSRAPIGYLAIADMPVAVNQGFIAMVCDRELPNHYVRMWAKENMELIEASANGTTFLEISKANFRPLRVIVPPKSLLNAFNQQVEPIHRRMVSNLRESLTLVELRDTLLPKLLSENTPFRNGFRI